MHSEVMIDSAKIKCEDGDEIVLGSYNRSNGKEVKQLKKKITKVAAYASKGFTSAG